MNPIHSLRLAVAAVLLLPALLLLSSRSHAQGYGLTERPDVDAFYDGTFPEEAPSIPANWSTVQAFPNLSFVCPVGLTAIPGTNRLIVWEREGKIWSFENNPTVSTKTLVIDLSANTQGWDDSGMLGLALHPDFANNRQMWIWYNWRGGQSGGAGDLGPVIGDSENRPPTATPTRNRLSRFILDANYQTTQAGEYVVIDQKDGTVWHNGGGLFFHPQNGFLYITNGDDQNGGLHTQRIDLSLFSCVIRIDTDLRGGSISHAPTKRPENEVSPTWPRYYVPNDNPFVGQPNALEEIYALGLRSPHRMTIDPVTGRIFIGDVGQGSREEISVIEPSDPPGLNFQWNDIEGNNGDLTAPFIGTNKRPIIDYRHSEGVGSCVVGGYVYRGSEFPELNGKYIFGDNMTGFVWYLDESTVPATKVFLAQMPDGQGDNSGNDYRGLSSFGVDANNELYLCQLGTTQGKIYKLNRGGPAPGTPLPGTLSATGLFSNLATLTPSERLIPYALNAPFWSDGAIKTRFAAVPNNSTVGFEPTGQWNFPSGSVLVKHFDFPSSDVDPNAKRRLETRVIVKQPDGNVYGATYKWRADQSDADLLDAGLTESIPIATAPVGSFTSQDIGSPALAGSTVRDGSVITITAGGTDIWGTSDQFHFAHQQRTGDFDVSVRIESVVQADLYTKTGLMVRDTLAANARHVMALVFPSNAARNNNDGGYEFQYRANTGGGAVALYPADPQPRVNFPDTWLRMKREGDTFIAFCSSDGFTWAEYSRTTLDLPDTLYFGLAVTAHTASPVTVAKFHVDSRRQPWYYPSRQDCLRCHNPQAGGVLGPSTRQFNKEMLFPGGVTDNQLRAWGHVGLFDDAPAEAEIPTLEKLVHHNDTSASLQDRARSYIDANCSYCHRPDGVQALWDGRFETPFFDQGIMYGPVVDNLGDPDARVIVPQDLARSILHTRVNTVGDKQMPPLAKNRVDEEGVAMLAAWIQSIEPETVLPPSALVATALSNTEVELAWADQSDNEAGFSIERSLDSINFTAIGVTGPGETTYTDTTADPFSANYYRVAAFGNFVYSGYSNTAFATTDIGPPASEIRITGNGRIIQSGDLVTDYSDGTDFGMADPAGPAISRTFTLENLGNAALTLGGSPRIAISGPGASSFSIVAQPAASLAGPGGTTFQITFTPSSAGPKSATVSIPSNDPSEPVTTFAISGNAVPQALLGWWRLEDGGGTSATDSSGNNRTGTLNAPLPLWEPDGKFGGALEFTGVQNQGLVVPNSGFNPTAAISVMAWAYPFEWNGNRRLLQKGNNDNQYRLLAENGSLVWEIATRGRIEVDLPPVNEWTHIAGTYDGTEMRLYMNGQIVETLAASGAIPTTTNALNIGTKVTNAPAGDHFKGYLDEIRVYGRALDPAELSLMGSQDSVVTLAATDATAQRGTADTGTFRVTRNGPTTEALQVGLSVSYGSNQALPRIDYTLAPLPTAFVIPAGQANATLTLAGVDRGTPTGPLTVTLALHDAEKYVAGAASSAQITLQDSPMNQWKTAVFGSLAAAQQPNAQDDADGDADGLSVLMEAALGGVPNAMDTPRLPSEEVELIEGQLYLTSTYTRPKPAIAGISYHHRTTLHLADGPWNQAVMVAGYPQDHLNGTETVKFRSLLPIGDEPKQFLRLEITRP